MCTPNAIKQPAAIGRRAATHADDQPARACIKCGADQLTGSERRGPPRVKPLDQLQTGSKRHLDHGCAAVGKHGEIRIDRFSKRAAHPAGLTPATVEEKCVNCPVAAIGNGK